jgi:hypothetical protein
MMRATVAASIAASSGLAQQARAASSSPSQATGATASLAAASASAREAVTSFERDMYEKKIFDPYLHFASKEDEEAYRKREAERKQATDVALKQNTPEGNLRAADLSIAQLNDAGAHGATASPEYQTKMDGLTSTRDNLAAQVAAPKQQANADARISADGQSPTSLQNIEVPPDVLASLRSVVASNSPDSGHGVTRFDQAEPTQGRS